jgi:two-component system sensor histidine kinase KdpD
MPRVDRRQLIRSLLAAIGSLLAASLVVGGLESYVQVPNASIVYLAAVVATALVGGTWGAIAAAVASFLLYDFFFTEPYHTFTVRDPEEWLSVILLLFVGIVVGQLVAIQRTRADEARSREREAYALFQVSRALATRTSTSAVLPAIAGIVGREAHMDRVWFTLGGEGRERIVADSGTDNRPAPPPVQHVLRRMPGDEPAQWVRVHVAGQPRTARAGMHLEAFRVRIEAAGDALGSVWALRGRAAGRPDRTETRLLAAAADQVGGALAHDQLAAEAQAAEIARQSDELKSALLQSVSHDLRTPLATIRAAAGTLRPGTGLSVEDQAESADAIDREVEYLNRLVTNLLDLSRIEAGTLKADRDVFELDDLIGRTIERLRTRLAGRPLTVEVDVPPVEVDPIFLDESLTNALENAIKHTPPATPIRVRAAVLPDEPIVRLSIEDAGPGVPDEHLTRLFDKFYRAPGAARSSRSGAGVGLAVVRGLTEAMGGRATARRSELGGLSIDLDIQLAALPAELVAAPRP